MKLTHHITGTIFALVFATTSALPAAGIPQFKAPVAVKAAPAAPRVVTPPKVPVVRVPIVPKVPVTPRIPTVKIPAAPKIPTVKVPAVKVPNVPKVVKAPVAPKIPTVKVPVVANVPTIPRSVKTPVVVKVPAAPKPVLTVKVPVVKQPIVTKVPVTVKPVVVISKPSPIATKSSEKSSKGGSSLADITSAPPPNTTFTIQGGNKSGGNSSSNNTSAAADKDVADQLAALGFSDSEAAKIIAQLQDPATRAAAEAAVKGKADAESTRQLIGSLVSDEQAAVIAKKIADPATREKTEKNLKLVLEATATLQLAGVDSEKADRITKGLIRTGTTDANEINEIVGRVIIKDLTGTNAPQSDIDDPNAPTALDVVKSVLDAKASLQLVGAADDDEAVKKAIEEIVKNRVTDPEKAHKIVEVAAGTVLENQGILSPAKPGETLKDRLNRAAEEQKEASKPKKTDEPKTPVNLPSETTISLGGSLKAIIAKAIGADERKGPKNEIGSSPSVLEIVFGSKKPRTSGPKGVKDGKFTSGLTQGTNVQGSNNGIGKGTGKGRAGKVGDATGKIVGKAGQVSQPVGTGGVTLAKDPDSSPIKDASRSPKQPVDGTPVDNNTPPAPAGNDAAPDNAATGNAQVAGEQDLPNTNPQQGDATDPAGSNMDTSTGTFTVTDAPASGANGTTTVGFSVTGSPGGAEDGNYVTTYFSDGTYITERVTPDGGHELVGGGNGTPPNVQEGDSTNVVQGGEAVFAGDDSGDTTSSTDSSTTDSNGGGSNDDDDDDKDNDNSTDTPPATTESEDEPADTAAAEDDTAEASKEGTPNPDAAERGSRGGRLAEATQGRVGGDEQRRQNKGLDQRKNGNGVGTPNPDGNTRSGVLFTKEEQKAFNTLLGMKRSNGVTTPTGEDTNVAVTDRDLKDLVARRGSLINPANGRDGKGGSGLSFGKKGFAPGTGGAPAPAPKGQQAAVAAPAAVQVGVPAAAISVKGAAVRIDTSKVQQNAR